MPEGDTIYRIADVMRRVLLDGEVVAARGRPGGARLEQVVGTRVQSVTTRGKHLLVGFDGGLTLHAHLQMRGTWHRYRPGEPWRRQADRAVAVLETASAVAVCFDAPTVELIETRALAIHPVLAELGPDLLAGEPQLDEVAARMAAGGARGLTIAEALIDQRVVAGIGNVYRSEVLASSLLSPWVTAGSLADEALARLLATASTMLRWNLDGGVRRTIPGAGGGERLVYGRAGRPCRRCGAPIRSSALGQPPRRVYWCPRCQAHQQAAA